MPSRVRLMQQPCITATEDLVIQKFSSNQAADLLGRACRGNHTGERKGCRRSLCEKRGDGSRNVFLENKSQYWVYSQYILYSQYLIRLNLIKMFQIWSSEISVRSRALLCVGAEGRDLLVQSSTAWQRDEQLREEP